MEKQALDPGLGEKYSGNTKRMINTDGSFNVTRSGGGFYIKDIYMYLVNTTWIRFFLIAAIFYIIVNFIFAGLYIVAGIEHLGGKDHNEMNDMLDALFFSAQTLTTVGYGGLSPHGILISTISAFEAMIGVLGFAVITGLLYGRFSKPSARILFSKNGIIAPYGDGKAFMFRVANQRKNNLMELEARVLVSFIDSRFNRKYYDCTLERSFVHFFPTSWTVVHPIDNESPFYNKTGEELKNADAEILILIKAFDETFGQVVHARYSYKYDEIVWNAVFKKAFNPDSSGQIVMNLNDIHSYEIINQ